MSKAPILEIKNHFESIFLSLPLSNNQLRRNEAHTKNLVSCKFFGVPLTWKQCDIPHYIPHYNGRSFYFIFYIVCVCTCQSDRLKLDLQHRLVISKLHGNCFGEVLWWIMAVDLQLFLDILVSIYDSWLTAVEKHKINYILVSSFLFLRKLSGQKKHYALGYIDYGWFDIWMQCQSEKKKCVHQLLNIQSLPSQYGWNNPKVTFT